MTKDEPFSLGQHTIRDVHRRIRVQVRTKHDLIKPVPSKPITDVPPELPADAQGLLPTFARTGSTPRRIRTTHSAVPLTWTTDDWQAQVHDLYTLRQYRLERYENSRRRVLQGKFNREDWKNIKPHEPTRLPTVNRHVTENVSIAQCEGCRDKIRRYHRPKPRPIGRQEQSKAWILDAERRERMNRMSAQVEGSEYRPYVPTSIESLADKDTIAEHWFVEEERPRVPRGKKEDVMPIFKEPFTL